MGRVISDKDLLILSLLRKNSRETLTKISKKTKIPISTIFDKLRLLEKEYIKKHACIVDFSKLGYNMKSHICIKSHNNSNEDLKEFLLSHNNVNSVFKLEDNQDMMVESVFRNSFDLNAFLSIIRSKFNIETIEVKNIVDEIVKEKFLENVNTCTN